jgi:hypothetical protein
LQAKMREYTALRIAAVNDASRPAAFADDIARANALQGEIWALASRAASQAPTPVSALLIAALNDMIDQSLVARRAFTEKIPVGVLRMLLWTTIVSVGVIGFNFGLGGTRQTLVSTFLLVFWVSGLLLIVDLNDPTRGSIGVDPAPLVWTLEGFGAGP